MVVISLVDSPNSSRISLNRWDIRVKSVKTQRRMKKLLGRDIWLDIDADDETGKEYNAEEIPELSVR